MSEATPMIYGAICQAMSEIGAITKEKRNSQQGFMYRGIDDVMNALYPVLSKHGLFLTPEVLEHTREERQTKNGGNLIYSILRVRYTLFAKDGSNISAVVIGEGMDSADKSSNKAMSVAMKYAMFQLFCIPTEEMADPDADTPPASTPKTSTPKTSAPPIDSKPTAPARPPLICLNCKKEIPGIKDSKGYRSPEKVAEFTKAQTGAHMCYDCYKRLASGENI